MAHNESVIVKRVKKAAHKHHGGAWKIAYADFVTAMMAFFLLLWLVATATPEQKEGLAEYFSPHETAEAHGAGAAEPAAQTASASEAAHAETSHDASTKETQGQAEGGGGQSAADLKAAEDRAFHSAASSIRQAWQAMPEVTELAENLIVEVTEEGLDIQIIDQEGRPMFPEGSKYPHEATRQAIAAIAPMLQQLPNQIRISGHTAAGATYSNPRYDAWDLSSDRANVTRETLGEFGLSSDHIHSVVGRAAEEPYFPNDPYLMANNRIKITVLHKAPPIPMGMEP